MYINISEALKAIETLHQKNTELRSPVRLYQPRNYIMSMPGKKMRSLLCLMGYGLYKEDYVDCLDLAYVVELFHNFTLVHDDIMDEATLRRGLPAVHIKYDQSSAILSGDLMLIEAYDRLCQLPLDKPMEYLNLFNIMGREVCEGQSLDMEFETRDDVTIEEYLKMIELKTAVLLGLSLRIGAKYAGASPTDERHLYHFGVNAGIGFQLQDDLLDIYGDPEKFGKKSGGDIIQGKKSYLYLRAMSLLSDDAKEDFRNIYAQSNIDPDEKIMEVKQIYDELHVLHYCQEAKQAYFDLAVSHINAVSAPQVHKDSLVEFSKSLLHRES